MIRTKIIFIAIIGIVLCAAAFYVGETGRIFGAFINRFAPCTEVPQNSFPCYGAYDVGLMVVAVLFGIFFLVLLFLKPSLVLTVKRSRITYLAIIAITAAVMGFAYYSAHSYAPPTSALSPRAVSAAKVPDGWYEHMVELEGAPPPTIIVLTKHATLPIRNAGDGQYDDPQITITNATTTGTPEEYIAQEGLSGENAKVMGISGSWSSFVGHKMFAIDLDQVGQTVILFGEGKEYSFILSSTDPTDANAFWQVITYYAQASFFADTSGWKTYTDPSTSFTMKYPPQYSIDAHVPQPLTADDGPPLYGWGSRTLLQIYDPASTSTGEFAIGPVQVTLQKKPLIANERALDSIVTYQQSGIPMEGLGAPNPKGDLMTVASGEQGLFYSLPADIDTGADPVDSFTFIKNNLIYYVSFDANDPNEQGMLESVAWQ